MEKQFEKLDRNEYLKFYKSLHDARIVNKHGCFVSLDRPETYESQINFLLDDGVAWFSISNGDLVAVHKNPLLANQKGYKYVAEEIMLVAIANGAITLDCYGDFLANMYMQYGFIPTGKMKFNKEYNPDWDTSVHGEPDVIALCRAVQSVDELITLRENNEMMTYSEIVDSLPEYTDYIKLLNDRNEIFTRLQSDNLSYKKACEFVKMQIKKYGEWYGKDYSKHIKINAKTKKICNV